MLLRRVCEESCDLLGADRALIARVDFNEVIRQEIIQVHQAPPEFLDLAERSTLVLQMLPDLFREGRPHIAQGLVFDPNSDLGDAGNQTVCIVPLIVDREPYGWLALVHLSSKEYFHEDLMLAESLGDLASLAIRNASRERDSTRTLVRGTALSAAAAQLAEGRGLSAVLESLAESAARVFGGEAGFRILEDEHLVRAAATPAARFSMKTDRARIDTTLGGRAALLGEPVLSPDAALDPRIGEIDREAIVPERTGSWMILPAKSGGRVRGTLHIFREQGHEFIQKEIDMGISLADQAALAIELSALRQEDQRTEGLFEAMIEGCEDAIFAFNRKFELVHWNAGAEDLLGYSSNEAAGRPIESVLAEARLFREKAQHVFDIGNRIRFEDTYKSKFGFMVPASVKIIPLKDEDGKITAAAALLRDLTGQRRAESDLILRDRALDSTDHGVLITDPSLPNNPIIYANESFERITGYAISEVFGRSLRFLQGEEEGQPDIDEIRKSVEENRAGHAVLRSPRKDGTLFWNEMHIIPFRDDIGAITHHITVICDITDQKKAGERLVQAKDEAEAANRAKDEYLANINHELRSPLGSMAAFGETLLIRPDAETALDIGRKIKGTAGHLARLIEDILDFNRIESGKISLNREDTLISDLVNHTIGELQFRTPEGISFRTVLDPAFDLLSCDPGHIRRVLTNLLDNAVKYSPGGGAITVRTESYPGEIRVSVQDEGIGIAPDDREAVFDRFRQLESGAGRESGGLGIGLNIAQKLIHLHGGRIWVESEEGRGSTFIFALPQSVGAERGALARPAPVAAPGTEEPPLPDAGEIDIGEGGRKGDNFGEPWAERSILVVDDDPNFHEYIELLMASAAQVFPARDGKQGVEAALRLKPDLIFMDLRMPVLDGFSAIENLKSDPETKDIPVLAVTAHGVEEIRPRAIAAGADGIITKPIDSLFLTEEVERVLSRAG
jgi:PAS domain S-box-containing protein